MVVGGALRTMSEARSGVGRHRRDDGEAVYIAATLDALADVGLRIEALIAVGDGLRKWRSENGPHRKALDDAIAGRDVIYLWTQIQLMGPSQGRVTVLLKTMRS